MLLIGSCKKEENNATGTTELFFPKVRTIIQKNCTVSCHAPGLGFPQGLPVVLETDSDIVKHASSINAAIFGPFTMTNKQMPPSGKLSDSDKNIIKAWLSRGATLVVCGVKH